MNQSDISTSRRTYLTATGTATAGMVSFAGCLGGDDTGTLATQVTGSYVLQPVAQGITVEYEDEE